MVCIVHLEKFLIAKPRTTVYSKREQQGKATLNFCR